MQVLIERPAATSAGGLRQHGKRNVHRNRPRLADAQRPAVALVFDRRISPSRQVDDVIGAGQRKPDAARSRRKNHTLNRSGAVWKRSTPA